MSPRPRRVERDDQPATHSRSAARRENVMAGRDMEEGVGTWRCTTCQHGVEGAPGEPTKDPKFRIGKCPFCGFDAAMFLRVKE
jgi:rubredoxin